MRLISWTLRSGSEQSLPRVIALSLSISIIAFIHDRFSVFMYLPVNYIIPLSK